MAEFIDITKMGPQTYSQLQEQNDLSQVPVTEGMGRLYGNGPSAYGAENVSGIESLVNVGLDNWGESRYDNNYATGDEVNHLGDIRAKNQPGIAKLAAGIGKAGVLAGTTFVDGTIGLVYGIGTAISEQRFSGLWDNDVSNAMAAINKASEEWMPNYYTEEENNKPWYMRMNTVNFWADSFIKNMGFTVGAFYSGKLWAAPLQVLKMPALAGEITGSLLSAVNEGRIEANNGAMDYENAELPKLNANYERARQEIINSIGPADLEVNSMYNVNKALAEKRLQELDAEYEKQLADLNHRADSMGAGILLANIPLLFGTNFKTLGKMYSQGFKRAARDLADTEKKLLAGRIVTENGKNVWKDFTIKDAAKGGIKIALREGPVEEMGQAAITETFRVYNTPDSPDAYYDALINPDSQIKTSDFLTSLGQGFVNTYGNADRWEEGFIGAMTGLLGMPTFGRVNNASANTYLGRDKFIGLSGGIFGEASLNRERNIIGNRATSIMNKYADKVQNQKDYFVQSQTFTDAMEGWVAEHNAFEYKNAEDNDDFAAIAAYARVGHLQDLKDLVNKDFENMSDEDLQRIALYTSKTDEGVDNPIGGWRNTDGTYMYETEEGRTTMRQELAKKRDKILKNIEDYENSVQLVRSAVGESPKADESQVEELAWLHWKLGRFNDRFGELKKENDPLFNDYLTGLNEYKNALEKEIEDQQASLQISENPSRTSDPKYQEALQTLGGLNQRIQFIQQLKTMKSPLALATFMQNEDFSKFVKDLFGEQSFELFETLAQGHLNYAQADKLFKDIQDLTKMAIAAEQFNQRYKEYMSNPSSILANRKKREDKVKQKTEVKAAENLVDQMDEDFDSVVNDNSVRDLIDTLEKGQDESHDYSEQIERLEQLEVLNSKKERIIRALNNAHGIDAQIKKDVAVLLNKITSERDLYNFNSELYNDPNNLYDEEDPSLINRSNEEIMYILEERLNKAKTYLNYAKDAISREDAAMDNINEEAFAEAKAAETESSGNDETTVVDDAINSAENSTETPAISNETLELANLIDLDSSDSDLMQALQNVFSKVKEGVNKGQSLADVLKILLNDENYNKLQKAASEIDLYISQYYNDHNKEVQNYNPSNPVENAPKADDDIKKENDNSLVGQSSNTSKQYWAPIQSRLPIHISEASTTPLTPYYKLVGTPGYQNYTEAQIKYIQAVGEYLEEKGAWNRVDSGLLSKNEEIHFTTDPALNEKAGTFVILIADKDGNVLGNLPVEGLDATFGTYTGLKEFTDYLKSEYETKGTVPNVTSHLNKWMIGKVMYSLPEVYSTVREIFTKMDSQGNKTQQPFMFGIGAVTRSGQVRVVINPRMRQSTAPEKSILQPLSVRNGQPYVLISTQNPSTRNKFVAVPVTMRIITNENTPINNSIRDVLSKIFTLTTANSSRDVAKVRQSLEELVGSKFFITVNSNELKLSIKNKEGKWEIILKDISRNPENIPNIVNDIMNYFANNGIRYQMSLMRINQKYNGNDYNDMLADVVDTDVLPGQTSTLSNWFTINPIQKNQQGVFEEMKASSPKSTGISTTNIVGPANTSFFNFYYGDQRLAIDTSNWETIQYRQDGKTKIAYVHDPATGKLNLNAATMAAYAYGLNKQVKMSEPYRTPWGMFNAMTRQFVKEVTPTQSSVSASTTASVNEATQQSTETTTVETPKETVKDLETQAKESGILQNPLYKKIWSKLSDELKQAVFKGHSAKEQMEILQQAYSAKTKTFKKSEKELLSDLTPKYRKENNAESYVKWNQQAEMKWLEKVLPQFTTSDRLQLVESIIKVANSENPEYAWGQFKNGIITIYKGAAQGTLYHEAFHTVTQTILSEQELDSLYKAAQTKYGEKSNNELEEDLAEDFRKYIQYEEDPNINAITRIFRKLKHFVQTLYGKSRVINKTFYNIARGNYKNAKINSKNTSFTSKTQYEREYEEILKNAPRDKEGKLLAPNGKPSNLTKRQYAQVRTKAFKDWFGDWENDPTNASKVVDENGEPLIVYHGTITPGITIFDLNKTQSGKAFWFANTEAQKIVFYSNQNDKNLIMMPLFINMRTPLLNDVNSMEYYATNETYDGGLILGKLKTLKDNFSEENYQELLNKGLNDDSYLAAGNVTNPNQIKSADSNIGTFDSNNNDIRYRTASENEHAQALYKYIQDAENYIVEMLNYFGVDSIKALQEKLSHPYKGLNVKWTTINGAKTAFLANRVGEKMNLGNKSSAEKFISEHPELRGIATDTPYKGQGYIEFKSTGEIKKILNDFNKTLGALSHSKVELKKMQENDAFVGTLFADEEFNSIKNYYTKKYNYDNLTQEQKDLLTYKGISKEQFDNMSTEEKEHLLYCG